MKRFRLGAALALVVGMAAVTGCDRGADERPAGDREAVEVWLSRMEEPVAVERQVRGAPLEGALVALLAGPTAEEREAGLSSWFSTETRGALRRVRAEAGDVVVDFRGDLAALIPGAASSAGSEQLLMALDSTVFQFSWVESVEYQLEGSCEAFWEWLQRDCTVVRRE